MIREERKNADSKLKKIELFITTTVRTSKPAQLGQIPYLIEM
jgi:hypothetical protein